MKNQFVWNPLYNIIMDLKKQYIKENNIIDFANTYKTYNKDRVRRSLYGG